jgi:hypothetical protein
MGKYQPASHMKLGGERVPILSIGSVFYNTKHIHIQMTFVSSLNDVQIPVFHQNL